MTNPIVGDAVRQAAVANFTLEPLQIENSQTSTNQRLIYQIVATFEANGTRTMAGKLQLRCGAPNAHLLAGKDRRKRDGNIVDMLGRSIQNIQPNLTVGAFYRWVGRQIFENLAPVGALLCIQIQRG